jgi:hypothetical protein
MEGVLWIFTTLKYGKHTKHYTTEAALINYQKVFGLCSSAILHIEHHVSGVGSAFIFWLSVRAFSFGSIGNGQCQLVEQEIPECPTSLNNS